MHLEIVTPEKKLFTGSINSIKVPGKDGEFEILIIMLQLFQLLLKVKLELFQLTKKLKIFKLVVELSRCRKIT